MPFRLEIGLHCLIMSNCALARKNKQILMHPNKVKLAIYRISKFLEVILDEQAGLILTWPEPGRQIFFSRTEIYLLDARL